MSSPAVFWPEALPYARQAHSATGVLVSVILAQWAAETGFGGPDWLPPRNNPGNVGNTEEAGQLDFPTLQAGVNAYIKTMELGYYTAVRSAVGSTAQALALGHSPWAAAHYGNPPGSLLVQIIAEYDLTQFDAAAPPPPAPTPPTPPIQEVSMLAYDPTSEGFWATDVNGDLYCQNGAPFVQGLNQHPNYDAGDEESNNQNPCIGLAPFRDANGEIGICFVTQPVAGGTVGTPYAFYRFARNGQPD